MKNSERNLLMPMMAMAFAVAGAFATQAMEEKSTNQVPGYIDAPEPCQIEVQCSTIEGPICTDSLGQQAFGLNESQTRCTEELYQLRP